MIANEKERLSNAGARSQARRFGMHDSRIRIGFVSAAAYGGMFVFGIVMALLGAILPSLSTRLQFQVADIGNLFLAMNFGMLVCCLLVGVALDRFGMKPALSVGPLLVAGALVLIVRATAFRDLFPAVVLLGIGGGVLNAATNTTVADLHDDPRAKSSALNLLGVSYGFGALFLPFVIGAVVTNFGINRLVLAAAVLCIAAGALPLPFAFPKPKQPQRLPVSDMPRFLRLPVVRAMAVLLFFLSGVEFTLGGYISTYLTREMTLPVSTASWMLVAYWASMMIARAVLSRVMLAADPNRIVLLGAVVAGVGAVGVALAPGTIVATVSIVLTGLGIAGLFPTVLGIAGSRFQEHSGTVFGILLTIALSGGMTLPWLSGLTAGAFGLRWVFALVAFAFGVIAMMSRVIAAQKS